ncbi:hydantoinase B/oxoprolinase family protein, partial [Rhodococcus erythropolis]|nr:hydantoinase B/oxoprolinase family protein [Rhodococcus erythropolis]
PIEEVLRDIQWRKVSVEGARDDYGVVMIEGDEPSVDEAATTELRDQLRSERGENEPFFDRGPGYAQLSGGATSAVYDYV